MDPDQWSWGRCWELKVKPRSWALLHQAARSRDEPTDPSQEADVHMKFPLCMCRRGSGSSDLQLWGKKQNRAPQGGDQTEPKLAGSSTGHRHCCVLLPLSPYTGSSGARAQKRMKSYKSVHTCAKKIIIKKKSACSFPSRTASGATGAGSASLCLKSKGITRAQGVS